MDLTANHDAQLLGLQSPWKVTSVDLDINALRVDIRVVHEGESGHCPECAKVCKVYDQSAERISGISTFRRASSLRSPSLQAT